MIIRRWMSCQHYINTTLDTGNPAVAATAERQSRQSMAPAHVPVVDGRDRQMQDCQRRDGEEFKWTRA